MEEQYENRVIPTLKDKSLEQITEEVLEEKETLIKNNIREKLLKELSKKNKIGDYTQKEIDTEVESEYSWIMQFENYKAYNDGSDEPLKVQILTTPDEKCCDYCKQFNGKTFTLDEVKKVFKRHWGCRCALSPVVGLDD